MLKPQPQLAPQAKPAESKPYDAQPHEPDESSVINLLKLCEGQDMTVESILDMVCVTPQEASVAVDFVEAMALDTLDMSYTPEQGCQIETEGGNYITCASPMFAPQMARMGANERTAFLAYIMVRAQRRLENMLPGYSTNIPICSVCWIRGCTIGPMVSINVR